MGGKIGEPSDAKSDFLESQVRTSGRLLVNADAPEARSAEALNAKFLELELETLQTKFLELEYNTLRREIESGRERAFKIIIGGLFVVPAAQYLAQAFNIGIFKLLLPLLVISLYILFLAEAHAIHRCASYIRTEIEPAVRGDEGGRARMVEGWETWLERINNRTHENQLKFAFNILSVLFYFAATLIAATVPRSNDPLLSPILKSVERSSGFEFLRHPAGWPLAIVGVYLLIGIAAAIVLWQTQKDTSRPYEAVFVGHQENRNQSR